MGGVDVATDEEVLAVFHSTVSHGYSDTLRMFDNTPGIYSYWDMKSRARDRDIGWRIDYFFVSDSFKANVTNATVLRDQLGSDHCPITVTLDA